MEEQNEAQFVEAEDYAPTTRVRPQKRDRTTMALLFVAALVAVGGIGFAGGRLTASSSTAAANQAFTRGGGRNFGGNFPGGALPSLAPGQTFTVPGNGFGGGGFRGLGGGGVTGTVQSVNASSMTIQLSNGQTVTVDLTGDTTYHGETSASAGQVKVGSSVTVQIDTGALANETPNPNGSGALGGRQLTAKDVLIANP